MRRSDCMMAVQKQAEGDNKLVLVILPGAAVRVVGLQPATPGGRGRGD